MRKILSLFVLLFSLNSYSSADGTIDMGIDPLYSASTEMVVSGYAAYVIQAGFERAGIKTDSTGLTVGESFACRKFEINKLDPSIQEEIKLFLKEGNSGEALMYKCAAKYNYERKGELRPLDPAKSR